VAVKGGAIVNREALARLTPRFGPAEIQIGEDLFICPTREEDRDGSMIWSNHSCDPNIGVRGQIVFVAMRDIAAGEELTHDWATTDDDDGSMTCRCGAAACRGTVTGKDWRRRELQGQIREGLVVALPDRLASGQVRLDPRELMDPEGGLEIRHVVFEAGLGHLVVHVAVVGKALPGILAHPVERERLHTRGQCRIGGDEHSALGGGEVLGRVEGEAGDVGRARHMMAGRVAGLDRVGTIPDHPE